MNVCRCYHCQEPLTANSIRFFYMAVDREPGIQRTEFCADCFGKIPARAILESEQLLTDYCERQQRSQINNDTYKCNWSEEGF